MSYLADGDGDGRRRSGKDIDTVYPTLLTLHAPIALLLYWKALADQHISLLKLLYQTNWQIARLCESGDFIPNKTSFQVSNLSRPFAPRILRPIYVGLSRVG